MSFPPSGKEWENSLSGHKDTDKETFQRTWGVYKHFRAKFLKSAMSITLPLTSTSWLIFSSCFKFYVRQGMRLILVIFVSSHFELGKMLIKSKFKVDLVPVSRTLYFFENVSRSGINGIVGALRNFNTFEASMPCNNHSLGHSSSLYAGVRMRIMEQPLFLGEYV